MDTELTVQQLLERAVTLFPDRDLVTSRADGSSHRYTYRDAYERICQLAHALDELGVEQGDRVATMAANHYRHFELYYGPACSGRSMHMVNHRLPEEHLEYLFTDAKDRVVFLDPDFVQIVEPLADDLDSVEQYVVLDDELPETSLDPICTYEDLLEGHPTDYDWPEIDEETECGICYTSGTTGKPKGVQYTHRAVYLHSMMCSHVDTNRVSQRDTILVAVPMFHANAWGFPYAAAFSGSKLVFPGGDLSPENVATLIESEGVTASAGVPTIWIDLAEYLDDHPEADISSIDRITVGGSAPPESLIRTYDEEYDAPLLQGYGMTETSPLQTISTLTSETAALPSEERYEYRAKAGIPVPGIEMRVRNEDGEDVARDGEAFGEVQVRGPWVADRYHDRPEANEESFTDDGWLKTGDVATWDEHGYIDIVDRTSDIIKSGGEWISSVELENELMAHDAVKEAAVVGVPHERWQERPLSYVVLHDDADVSSEALRDHLDDRFPSWWLPDEVEIVSEIPRTSTGKFDKKTLRERFTEMRGALSGD
ncbi:long-chain fatty acid--CoA ligase [Natrinema amylolyticum]|uniref:long-chain fatty acid--CoA ligase n=1 Tax=Natrinema amylolyticum TaxID=2878679 RepID=UPI003CCD2A36